MPRERRNLTVVPDEAVQPTSAGPLCSMLRDVKELTAVLATGLPVADALVFDARVVAETSDGQSGAS